jgi:hypothetical protein
MSLTLNTAFLVTEETVSAVVCFFLVWFLIKPYLATREGRYLGLPLGFGFLGVTYVLSALTHLISSPKFMVNDLAYFQLLARPFAFLFLVFTYYFSDKPSNKRLAWNITLSVMVVALTSLVILLFVAPQTALGGYRTLGIYVRILCLGCLIYISAHTLLSHLKAHNTKTILTPFGFIFLAISQYSVLIWAYEGGDLAFYSGLVIRWIGLALFLVVAYRSFYGKQKGSP